MQTNSIGMRGLWITAMVVAAASAATGCSADGNDLASTSLEAADDSTTAAAEITQSYPVGTIVETSANLNLRTGPSTGYRVIVVIPEGSQATIAESSPTNSFYHLRFGSYEGYSSGSYLRIVSADSTNTPVEDPTPSDPGTGSSSSSDTTASASNYFARARSAVGFAYWWGHGAWLEEGPTSATQGVCSGSCPSCSHSGHYGADCSGLVAKAWMVPSNNVTLSTDAHPYGTSDFRYTTGGGRWTQISRSNTQPGDALVYNNGSSGHTFLVESGDPWGQMWVYEAPGCASGGGRVHHVIRSATSSYVAIRRN